MDNKEALKALQEKMKREREQSSHDPIDSQPPLTEAASAASATREQVQEIVEKMIAPLMQKIIAEFRATTDVQEMQIKALQDSLRGFTPEQQETLKRLLAHIKQQHLSDLEKAMTRMDEKSKSILQWIVENQEQHLNAARSPSAQPRLTAETTRREKNITPKAL
jgi:uncharacterized protein YicC (UPF0701 family)